MPKTNFCHGRKKNMIKNLPVFIRAKMFENDMTYEDLATDIDITKQALCYRFKAGKTNARDMFSYGDLITIFKETKATDEEILKVMKL